jgi:dimethylargininase
LDSKSEDVTPLSPKSEDVTPLSPKSEDVTPPFAKTAVTQVSREAVLLNPQWVDGRTFEGMELITVDPEEPYGANALLVAERVIYPAGFPRTRERLEARGVSVTTVAAGELAKAEAGVTCCSILIEE